MPKVKENQCHVIVNKHRRPIFACLDSSNCSYWVKQGGPIRFCSSQGGLVSGEFHGGTWLECTDKGARIDAAKKAENDIAEELIEMEEGSD